MTDEEKIVVEGLTAVLIGITATLGFMAIGLGLFVVDAHHQRLSKRH